MIPLMKNAFLNEYETKKALAEFILSTSKFSMDKQCFEFEKEFSRWQGRSDSILFNSGGSANLAMLQALKNLGHLKDGDKIGFSALTWSTNIMPIIQLGMIPVPIDCDPSTLNIMSKNLEKSLSQTKLKAIFITNALGFAGDLDNIKKLCDKHKILLVEDNCEALGTQLKTGKAGNFSLAASFSFFVAHHMSTIEGGMVSTDDEEFAEMLRIVRANGWDRNLNAKQQFKLREKHAIMSEFLAKYTFYDLAYNFRPTEITGFLGRYQLRFLDDNIQKRASNYKYLHSFVANNPDLIEIDISHISLVSNFAFPVVCKNVQLRDKYLAQFAGAGVEVRPMIAGNIAKQPFFSKYVKELYPLPGSDFVHDCGFYCGNYPELSENDLETISSCLMKY